MRRSQFTCRETSKVIWIWKIIFLKKKKKSNHLNINRNFLFIICISMVVFPSPQLISVCWGIPSVPGETLGACPCSRRDQLLPASAQSDWEVVSGSCGTAPQGLYPGIRTRPEWESGKRSKEEMNKPYQTNPNHLWQ